MTAIAFFLWSGLETGVCDWEPKPREKGALSIREGMSETRFMYYVLVLQVVRDEVGAFS